MYKVLRKWHLSCPLQIGNFHGTWLYSDTLWTHFAPISRKKKSHALRCIVWRSFEVRWKVLNLAHPTVGQTSKSNLLGPISALLKWRSCHGIGVGIGKKVDRKIIFFGNLDISNVLRSAPSGRISTFDPPLDAPRSVLISALWISTVRNTWELVAPCVWYPIKNVEFGAKCVHKVPKSSLCTACTKEAPYQTIGFPYRAPKLASGSPGRKPMTQL